MLGDTLGNVLIDDAGDLERILGLCPVAEHDGDGREDLNIDLCAVEVVKPRGVVPAVAVDVPEMLAVEHHGGLAGVIAMLERDPPRVAELLLQVRPLAREDVRVEVNLERAAPVPHVAVVVHMRTIGLAVLRDGTHPDHVTGPTCEGALTDASECVSMCFVVRMATY